VVAGLAFFIYCSLSTIGHPMHLKIAKNRWIGALLAGVLGVMPAAHAEPETERRWRQRRAFALPLHGRHAWL
jgi:hypothetical protein